MFAFSSSSRQTMHPIVMLLFVRQILTNIFQASRAIDSGFYNFNAAASFCSKPTGHAGQSTARILPHIGNRSITATFIVTGISFASIPVDPGCFRYTNWRRQYLTAGYGKTTRRSAAGLVKRSTSMTSLVYFDLYFPATK